MLQISSGRKKAREAGHAASLTPPAHKFAARPVEFVI